jgi:hypothetical protein
MADEVRAKQWKTNMGCMSWFIKKSCNFRQNSEIITKTRRMHNLFMDDEASEEDKEEEEEEEEDEHRGRMSAGGVSTPSLHSGLSYSLTGQGPPTGGHLPFELYNDFHAEAIRLVNKYCQANSHSF